MVSTSPRLGLASDRQPYASSTMERATKQTSFSHSEDPASRPTSSVRKRRDSLLQSSRSSETGTERLIERSETAAESPAIRADSWIPCGICRKPYAACRPEALLAHLGGHFEQRYTFHRCQQCQINFVSEGDLRKHLLSASRTNQCGFMFEHRMQCRGHHPPRWRRTWSSKDDDRFDFCYRVRQWEQSQLRASRSSDTKPVEAVVPSKRPFSIGSLTSLVRLPFSNYAKGSESTVNSPEQRQSIDSLPSAADVLGAALLRAVCTGNAELVKAFIHAGANVDFVDAFGFGIMHYAAQYGSPEVAWQIVRLGVDVNVPDKHGRAPLFHAVRTGRSVLVHYLVAWGAEPQIDDLRLAVESGNIEDAEILVEEWKHTGKSLDVLDELLLQAVQQRDKNMVEVLLSNGARAFATDSSGRTALTVATSSEDREIALLLIEYGAEPDGWNTKDDRSLAEVVKYRHLAQVELLLSKSN